MEIVVRILLAMLVVIGVYSVVYALVCSFRYKGIKSYAAWEVTFRHEDNVSPEMILRGLLAAAERSNVPVRTITVRTGAMSVNDEDICRRFGEKYPIFRFDMNVSRET